MYLIKNILLFCLLIVVGSRVNAQELNCAVTVNTSQIQESNKTIFETLQRQIREFMNNKKWTNDKFLNQERIECSILINITQRVSTDEFTSTIQIQARRPVYNSAWGSPLINHMDNEYGFRYVQDQVLEFDENNVENNLTAVLAYYAYLIIGLDYDSFSPNGGTPYYAKAQTIVNTAQNLPVRGWRAFESEKNRYWITEEMLRPQFKPLRNCMYKYHRMGFDKMSDNVAEGRMRVLEALKPLRETYNDLPNSFLMQFFFNAKADEIVSLFSQGTPDEKSQVTQLLTLIDPGNISKYNTIEAGGK